MKKVLLIIAIVIFGAHAVGASPLAYPSSYEQKKDDRKKDPPGPPVFKEKGKDDKLKNPPPKKDKRPE